MSFNLFRIVQYNTFILLKYKEIVNILDENESELDKNNDIKGDKNG